VIAALRGLQDEFNGKQTANVKVSLADLIVLGGCAAVEKAASDAGVQVSVPFTPGRRDTTQELTDIEMFDWLKPGREFRNGKSLAVALGIALPPHKTKRERIDGGAEKGIGMRNPTATAAPKCVRNCELVDMEDADREVKADPMSMASRRNVDGRLRKPVVFHGKACTSPSCDVFYSPKTGYCRWAAGGHQVEAVCVSSARTVLCGGCRATGIPTATAR
jgi:hypothetical protein